VTRLDLDRVARAAIEVADIQSAALFVVGPGSSDLVLGAAAGVDGSALDALVAAVRNPAHPINRAMHDEGPSFDVRPTAPGGPALRSHLPLRREAEGHAETVGVLAVAHDRSLDADARRALEKLADQAALAVERRT
jgi:GAF domain